MRFSETLLDGNRVGLTEYPCAKAMIDGEWRATQMQPCPTGIADEVTVQTTNFSDGPHALSAAPPTSPATAPAYSRPRC